MTPMLEKLKNFDANGLQLQDLVELSATADMILSKFDELKIETPKWLNETSLSLGRTIKARVLDIKSKRRDEIRANLSGMRTESEKRRDLRKELADLDSELEPV